MVKPWPRRLVHIISHILHVFLARCDFYRGDRVVVDEGFGRITGSHVGRRHAALRDTAQRSRQVTL